jgi:hypothetical protein
MAGSPAHARRGPDIKLDVKRPFDPVSQNSKTFWAPVGDIALWRDEKTGKWSGKVRIFCFDLTFHAFEHVPFVKEEGKTVYKGEERPQLELDVEPPF